MSSTTHKQKSVSICSHNYGWEQEDLSSVGLGSLCYRVSPMLVEQQEQHGPNSRRSLVSLPRATTIISHGAQYCLLSPSLLVIIGTGGQSV